MQKKNDKSQVNSENIFSQLSEGGKLHQDIILDTNIIFYSLSSDVKTKINLVLSQASAVGYTLSISDTSSFESLKKKCDLQEEQRILDYLEAYNRYKVGENVLILAARLHRIYDEYFSQRKIVLSSEDFHIAATSVLSGGLILSSDANDFPRPFFDEILKIPIFYEKNNRTKHIVAYLFRPDTNFMAGYFSE